MAICERFSNYFFDYVLQDFDLYKLLYRWCVYGSSCAGCDDDLIFIFFWGGGTFHPYWLSNLL